MWLNLQSPGVQDAKVMFFLFICLFSPYSSWISFHTKDRRVILALVATI